MDYDKLSQKFAEIYSNLPIKTRREVVVVIDDQPISWEIAYKEVENNTDMGKKILMKMQDLKIL